MNLRSTTSYLKGITIIIVLINHYLINYTESEIRIFAKSFIGIFYILSGYGIYLSINKYHEKYKNTYFALKYFFVKRVQRIYPLYWIGYILHLRLDYSQINCIDFFALRFSNPQTKWFVVSIIQCYIISPILYYLITQINIRKYILVCLLGLISTNIFCHIYGIQKISVWFYQGLFLNHIFLFAIGMASPKIIKKSLRNLHKNNSIVLRGPLIIALSLSFMIVSFYQMHKTSSNFYVNCFSIFSCLSSTIVFVQSILYLKPNLPFSNIGVKLGAYSYSLYILHGAYFGIISSSKFVTTPCLNHILTLLLFPFFFTICILVEDLLGGKFKITTAIKIFYIRLLTKNK